MVALTKLVATYVTKVADNYLNVEGKFQISANLNGSWKYCTEASAGQGTP